MKRFLVPLISLSLANCSQAADFCPREELGAADYYSDEGCWRSPDGDFQALMVLSETTSGYFPTFISLSCQNVEHGNEEMLSLADYRTPILYDGSSLDEEKFIDLGKPILSNFPNHKAPLSRTDKIFLVRSKATFLQHNSVSEVQFSKVGEVSNTGKSLGEILAYRSSC
ncbi:hypothetical protein GRI43_01295 [Altererythrobacter luteolus]|uniref:Uncharacterized protein n=1 Tax=Pontixanthobacter luteolus TaxID=295089 RepID=A0A6I4UVY4_9SPHN|nr:hypothetical protein [Pontixanthobacter luteolus]MXP46027.1 hypothetical protein [Pontixanthobacter luteolus]